MFDSQGNIYFETGNGTFSPYRVGNQVFGFDAQGFPLDGNYGDSFLKIATDTVHNSPTNQHKNGWGLQVVDYFTPFNEESLDESDRDLGSGGPIILPDSLGSSDHPHLLLGGGKEGKLYLIDRDDMGKSDPGYDQAGTFQNGGTDHVVQTISGAVSGLAQHACFGKCWFGCIARLAHIYHAQLWRSSHFLRRCQWGDLDRGRIFCQRH